MFKLIAACSLIASFSAQASDHSHHHIAEKAPASAAPSGQSLFHSQSKWRTADGKDVQLSSLQGKLSLVSMIYTSCQTACPMIVSEMKEISKDIPENQRDKVQIVLFSFDPAHDTPEALKAFSKKRALDSRWVLLSPASAEDTAEVTSLLGIKYKKLQNGHYVHSNVFFLLNAAGEIVAQKEGLKSDKAELKEALQKAMAAL